MTDQGRRRFLECAGLGVVGLATGKLLPSSGKASEGAPATGRPVRWAMVVDTVACAGKPGCTACIDLCHRVHNVPTVDEPGHEVKWVWESKVADALPDEASEHADDPLAARLVLTLCNHCDDPPCARVCPTAATWRRDDGIVMMDWHRCIGCRYCMAACPYGSRSFNFVDPRLHLKTIDPSFPTRTKGVVEKCTLCQERLDRGQRPACVEACPAGALSFGDLNDPQSPVRTALRGRHGVRRRPGLGTQPAVYYLL